MERSSRLSRPASTYPRLPGDWDDLIIVWGSAAWDATRLGSQSLAQALSADHPVLYVDPALSVARLAREKRFLHAVGAPRLRLISPGLAHLTALAPPATARLAAYGLARSWLAPPVRRAVRALGGSVRAALSGYVVYNPFGMCGERLRVFRVSDDFGALAHLSRLPTERLRRAELRLAGQADLLVCVSPPLVEKWRRLGFDPVLIPNGCDAELLAGSSHAPRPPDVTLAPPVAGMSGQISSRIDLRLLEAVADRGVSLLLVGRLRPDLPPDAVEPLLARPNVQWVGFRPYEELPGYLGAMDVGLVPYADTTFNRASFPLKILEYLAAGLPVVSTDLPAVGWLDTDLVRTARDPSTFADAVVDALRDADDAEQVARRQHFAAGHSWRHRAAEYEAAMAAVESGAPDAAR